MNMGSYDCAALATTVNVSHFVGADGVEQYHFMVRPTDYADAATQLEWVERAYDEALASMGLDRSTAVFRRFLCSDLANQAPVLQSRAFAATQPASTEEPCAVSWIGQPPMPPAKLALWAYHINDPAAPLEKTHHVATLSCRRHGLTHHWTTGLIHPHVQPSYEQTQEIMGAYEAFLQSRRMTLADHVVRTWFFVQNVDNNYAGMVQARRELFDQRGLTADTHYIASTGIEGTPADVAAKVALDAYAVEAVRPEQIEFLHALDHLSPTHVYGVTFERATAVSYRDRKQVFISGTASIDRKGNIVHPGDIGRQLDRTLENVQALLEQAGGTLDDMSVFIVYVRDPSDQAVVNQLMRDRFADAPMEVVVAPVCRPGWLVEIEGEALITVDSPKMPAF